MRWSRKVARVAGDDAGGPGRAEKDKGVQQNLFIFAGVLATVVTVMATVPVLGVPPAVIWVLLGTVLLLCALAFLWPLKRIEFDWLKLARRSKVAVVAVVVAVVAVFVVQPAWPHMVIWISGCEHPVEIRVLTSPDTVNAFREVAADYEKSTAESGHGCRAVNMYVFSMPVSKVAVAFAQGWADVPEPHPDLWLAGSALELRSVREATRVELDGDGVIAWSPLVLGVRAGAGYPGERIAPSWPELLERVSGAGIPVVRPNPTASAEGEAALLALYRADGDALISQAHAGTMERRHAKDLDAGGYPVEGDTDALLRIQTESARAAAQAGRTSDGRIAAAVVTSEQAVARFNQELGGRAAASCVTDGSATDCLRAYYPRTTPRLEYPFAAVHWNGTVANDATREPVRAFKAWLGGEPGRQALNNAKLRPVEGEVGSPLSEDNGVLPNPALAQAPPTATVAQRDDALKLYREARRNGRVLVAVDGSGSMQEGAVGGVRRIDVAREAVKRALAHLGPDDEYGLSDFSGQGVRTLLPVDAHPDPGPMNSALGAVTPDGGTPLYRMITEGVRVLGGGDPNALPAVIVLTDGEDTTSGLTAEQTASAVKDGGVRVYVITIGEVRCDQGGLVGLARGTGGSCYDSDAVTVGDDLAALFRQMWGM